MLNGCSLLTISDRENMRWTPGRASSNRYQGVGPIGDWHYYDMAQ